MATEFDVAVLGGGMAGSAAAIAAAQNRARVCIITGTPGATAMFSGAWRGPLPNGVRTALDNVDYRLFSAVLPLQLPHPTSGIVAANAAAPSHAHARIDADTLVVGIAGLPGYDATALAKRWGAGSAEMVLLDGTPAAGWAPASLATCIERDHKRFTQALRSATQRRNPKHVIMPAVLGTRHDGALHAELQSAAGCTITEALGTPPSLPGWRLQIALMLALNSARVAVFESKARATRRTNGTLEEVELLNGDVVRARTFILATGKYAAGGIEANGAFREPALDCPVWVNHLGEAFEEADALMLTDPVRTEDQPLLRAGVHTNSDQHPVNRTGDVVYRNVIIAGSIRAEWSTSSHGIGHAAEDGWNAGMRACEGGSVGA